MSCQGSKNEIGDLEIEWFRRLCFILGIYGEKEVVVFNR